MKKILVLNGSHSDLPLIDAAKRLGYHVTTTGNAPHLVGHRHADDYRCADFSDKEEILALARELRVDAICSCANDFGALTAAYVAQEMGLGGHDSYETALTLHHKHLFKAFALGHGITTPRAVQYDSPEDACSKADEENYPVIVKPVDLTGGKGVRKVGAAEQFENAVRDAFAKSRIGRFLVEDWVEGTYHSFSTFLVNRKVVFGFSDNEYSLNGVFHVSTSGGPATGFDSVRKQLVGEAEKVAELLALADGVFHMQYIHADGRAWIIEITRRCSGDFYPYPVRYACGIDWAEWIVKAESGHDCRDFPQAVQSGVYGRHCVFAERSGIVGDLTIDSELEGNVIEQFRILQKGEVIDDHRPTRMAAIVFLKYESTEEMEAKSLRMNELVSVQVT